MFSQDRKHYRPTPRTMNQAFGPYAKVTPIGHRTSKVAVVAGVVIVGAIYGLLMGWRG